MLYQNIADKELTAGEAASYIISQMKAFNLTTEEAIKVLDYTNEVSNNFAVSSVDIATALTKQSASLHAYGNEMEDVIALTTAGAEILTGNASKVARGIKTIGANIVNMAQGAKEFEITVQGATQTIKLWNDEGTDILSTYDVLKQIAQYWDDMSDAEKSALAITQAGKNQLDVYTAVVGNFNTAIEARTTALLSEGSAWKENAEYMESVEAHTQKLRAEWEKLILSAPFAELEKTLLKIGTALLKFVNSDLGQTIIKVTALTLVIGLLSKGILNLSAAIMSAPMGTFLANIRMLIAGTTSLSAVVNTLTASLLANPLFWGALAVAGITLLIKGLDKLIVTYDEQIQKLEEAKQAYDEAQSSIDSLEQKLKDLAEAKEEINQKKLEITDDDELQKLQRQSNELERQEATLNRQLAVARAKAEQAEREAKANAQAMLTKEEKVKVTTVGYGIFETKGTTQENFAKEVLVMQQLQQQIIDNNIALEELRKNESENQVEIDKLTKKNQALVDQFDKLEKEATESADTLTNITDILGDFSVTINGTEYSVNNLLDDFSAFVGWKRDATDATNEYIDATEEENDALNNEAQNVESAVNSFLSTTDDLQSAYETLNKAADEFNQNGYISGATLKKLAKLPAEFQAQLQNLNGTMTVTNGALQDQFELAKQLAIIEVQTETETQALAYAQSYLGQETANYGTDSEQAAPKVDKLTEATDKLSTATKDAVVAIWEVRNALGDDTASYEAFEEGLKKIYDAGEERKKTIEGIELDYVSSTTSNASKAKDAWVEAFEEEQRQLKHSLEMNEISEYEYYEKLKELNEKYFGEISGNHEKYIKEYQENEEEIYKGLKQVYDKVKDYLKEAVEQGYEKAINALKKEEKNVLAEIKKQLEALKKEKKSVLDGIKDQVNALKKEKEAVQKYWNDQIDAIKRENEVLQEQNELLEYQQALEQAKAKKVMVMQDGRFQLTENESAVAEAEQNLSQYQDQLSYEQQIQQMEDLRDAQVETLEQRIEALEDYYDYMEDYYDRQIESMEEYYNNVQEQYEKQIEALQAELDAFKEGYQKQEDLENARLAAQVLGINERSLLYETDLENLKNYINSFNQMLTQLGNKGATVAVDYKAVAASHEGIATIGSVDATVPHRASGDASFRGDEVALVGESPNAELVLGSKLNRSVNSGTLVNLSRGSGVVNAESTSTLAGLLNGLAKPSSVSNSRTTQQNFNFGTISLPNVSDADSFVNTLSHKFNNYAIQYGNTRR